MKLIYDFTSFFSLGNKNFNFFYRRPIEYDRFNLKNFVVALLVVTREDARDPGEGINFFFFFELEKEIDM